MTETLTAAYALRRPPSSTTAHLVTDGNDHAVCGTQVGDPAPAVTCTGCASKWAYTDEGRRTLHRLRAETNLLALARVMGNPPPPSPRPQPPRPDLATFRRRTDALGHLTALAHLLRHDDLLNWQNDRHDPPSRAEHPPADTPCSTGEPASQPASGGGPDARGAAADAGLDLP
jgi:hypothetical protein